MNEDLRTWFRQKWVRMDTKGNIKGSCGGRDDDEGKPKCVPAAKARSMSKSERATATRRKRREDPVTNRPGTGNKPIMVKTEEFIPEGNEPTNPALWSKAKSLAKKKFDVYPSAYANGWAAKYYKSKGGGWKSVKEENLDEKCWDGYKRVGMKKKGNKMVPNCVPEATDIIAKAKAKLTTEQKRYPREGFPKEGEYGYHPNPGLPPHEDDDQDMDKAYKHQTEKEGRKPLNAQTIEVSNKYVKEELGPDNEWGTDALRKKYAKATPGQEGLAADKIPTFDPRYDDVTTQYAGLSRPVSEGYLAEISAKGAIARDKFKKRVQKILSDPKSINRAKKVVAKQKAAAKAAEAPHLVMQLRKAVSIGSKVQFQDGQHHNIAPNHADRFMSKYNSAKSSIEKEALQKRAHKSHSEFMKAIAEDAEGVLGEVYSVHVKGNDNSPQFKKHIKGWGGKKHYVSDKGVAYKFKHSWQADGFHHGVKSGFRHLDSEHDGKVNEEVHENCGTPDCCQTCETADMGTHHVDSYEAHRGSGDRISPVIDHDDDDIRFQDFDETEFEEQLEADIHSMTWEDLVDLYDDDELEYYENEEDDEEDEEELEEGITPQGRLKKKFAAMRTKTRRNMAKNLAIKRVSTPARVKARSIRAARRMVYKRLLRNRDISSVSAAEKTRLEAQVKRMAPMVARLSVRIMPKMRKLEQSRIKRSRNKKKK